jgi:hypothetical protein
MQARHQQYNSDANAIAWRPPYRPGGKSRVLNPSNVCRLIDPVSDWSHELRVVRICDSRRFRFLKAAELFSGE